MIQFKPLNVIALLQKDSDNINQMITINNRYKVVLKTEVMICNDAYWLILYNMIALLQKDSDNINQMITINNRYKVVLKTEVMICNDAYWLILYNMITLGNDKVITLTK